MAKNNRYRIVVENKTSPSHRMKKITIVEAYHRSTWSTLDSGYTDYRYVFKLQIEKMGWGDGDQNTYFGPQMGASVATVKTVQCKTSLLV